MSWLALVLAVAGAATAAGAQDKKQVALLDFYYGTVHHWWSGTWDIGKGIADLIVTSLVKDGTCSVIERKKLDAILQEQNFSKSDRANAATAAKIGKVLGVNAIVVGSITQFGFEDKSLNVGGLVGRLPGFGAGKVGTSRVRRAWLSMPARSTSTPGKSPAWHPAQALPSVRVCCSAA